MTEQNPKMRILVIGDDNVAMVTKLMLEKGIDCDIITEAEFEKERLKNEVFPFELKELDLNLLKNFPEDNHCWWQRFEKKHKSRY